MNGLPVTPTPTISPAAAALVQPVERLAQLGEAAGPKVLGLVWSKPLSSVISAKRAGAGQVDVADEEWVTTSSGNESSAASRTVVGGAHAAASFP